MASEIPPIHGPDNPIKRALVNALSFVWIFVDPAVVDQQAGYYREVADRLSQNVDGLARQADVVENEAWLDSNGTVYAIRLRGSGEALQLSADEAMSRATLAADYAERIRSYRREILAEVAFLLTLALPIAGIPWLASRMAAGFAVRLLTKGHSLLKTFAGGIEFEGVRAGAQLVGRQGAKTLGRELASEPGQELGVNAYSQLGANWQGDQQGYDTRQATISALSAIYAMPPGSATNQFMNAIGRRFRADPGQDAGLLEQSIQAGASSAAGSAPAGIAAEATVDGDPSILTDSERWGQAFSPQTMLQAGLIGGTYPGTFHAANQVANSAPGWDPPNDDTPATPQPGQSGASSNADSGASGPAPAGAPGTTGSRGNTDAPAGSGAGGTSEAPGTQTGNGIQTSAHTGDGRADGDASGESGSTGSQSGSGDTAQDGDGSMVGTGGSDTSNQAGSSSENDSGTGSTRPPVTGNMGGDAGSDAPARPGTSHTNSQPNGQSQQQGQRHSNALVDDSAAHQDDDQKDASAVGDEQTADQVGAPPDASASGPDAQVRADVTEIGVPVTGGENTGSAAQTSGNASTTTTNGASADAKNGATGGIDGTGGTAPVHTVLIPPAPAAAASSERTAISAPNARRPGDTHHDVAPDTATDNVAADQTAGEVAEAAAETGIEAAGTESAGVAAEHTDPEESNASGVAAHDGRPNSERVLDREQSRNSGQHRTARRGRREVRPGPAPNGPTGVGSPGSAETAGRQTTERGQEPEPTADAPAETTSPSGPVPVGVGASAAMAEPATTPLPDGSSAELTPVSQPAKPQHTVVGLPSGPLPVARSSEPDDAAGPGNEDGARAKPGRSGVQAGTESGAPAMGGQPPVPPPIDPPLIDPPQSEPEPDPDDDGAGDRGDQRNPSESDEEEGRGAEVTLHLQGKTRDLAELPKQLRPFRRQLEESLRSWWHNAQDGFTVEVRIRTDRSAVSLRFDASRGHERRTGFDVYAVGGRRLVRTREMYGPDGSIDNVRVQLHPDAPDLALDELVALPEMREGHSYNRDQAIEFLRSWSGRPTAGEQVVVQAYREPNPLGDFLHVDVATFLQNGETVRDAAVFRGEVDPEHAPAGLTIVLEPGMTFADVERRVRLPEPDRSRLRAFLRPAAERARDGHRVEIFVQLPDRSGRLYAHFTAFMGDQRVSAAAVFEILAGRVSSPEAAENDNEVTRPGRDLSYRLRFEPGTEFRAQDITHRIMHVLGTRYDQSALAEYVGRSGVLDQIRELVDSGAMVELAVQPGRHPAGPVLELRVRGSRTGELVADSSVSALLPDLRHPPSAPSEPDHVSEPEGSEDEATADTGSAPSSEAETGTAESGQTDTEGARHDTQRSSSGWRSSPRTFIVPAAGRLIDHTEARWHSSTRQRLMRWDGVMFPRNLYEFALDQRTEPTPERDPRSIVRAAAEELAREGHGTFPIGDVAPTPGPGFTIETRPGVYRQVRVTIGEPPLSDAAMEVIWDSESADAVAEVRLSHWIASKRVGQALATAAEVIGTVERVGPALTAVDPAAVRDLVEFRATLAQARWLHQRGRRGAAAETRALLRELGLIGASLEHSRLVQLSGSDREMVEAVAGQREGTARRLGFGKGRAAVHPAVHPSVVNRSARQSPNSWVLRMEQDPDQDTWSIAVREVADPAGYSDVEREWLRDLSQRHGLPTEADGLPLGAHVSPALLAVLGDVRDPVVLERLRNLTDTRWPDAMAGSDAGSWVNIFVAPVLRHENGTAERLLWWQVQDSNGVEVSHGELVLPLRTGASRDPVGPSASIDGAPSVESATVPELAADKTPVPQSTATDGIEAGANSFVPVGGVLATFDAPGTREWGGNQVSRWTGAAGTVDLVTARLTAMLPVPSESESAAERAAAAELGLPVQQDLRPLGSDLVPGGVASLLPYGVDVDTNALEGVLNVVRELIGLGEQVSLEFQRHYPFGTRAPVSGRLRVFLETVSQAGSGQVIVLDAGGVPFGAGPSVPGTRLELPVDWSGWLDRTDGGSAGRTVTYVVLPPAGRTASSGRDPARNRPGDSAEAFGRALQDSGFSRRTGIRVSSEQVIRQTGDGAVESVTEHVVNPVDARAFRMVVRTGDAQVSEQRLLLRPGSRICEVTLSPGSDPALPQLAALLVGGLAHDNWSDGPDAVGAQLALLHQAIAENRGDAAVGGVLDWLDLANNTGLVLALDPNGLPAKVRTAIEQRLARAYGGERQGTDHGTRFVDLGVHYHGTEAGHRLVGVSDMSGTEAASPSKFKIPGAIATALGSDRAPEAAAVRAIVAVGGRTAPVQDYRGGLRYLRVYRVTPDQGEAFTLRVGLHENNESAPLEPGQALLAISGGPPAEPNPSLRQLQEGRPGLVTAVSDHRQADLLLSPELPAERVETLLAQVLAALSGDWADGPNPDRALLAEFRLLAWQDDASSRRELVTRLRELDLAALDRLADRLTDVDRELRRFVLQESTTRSAQTGAGPGPVTFFLLSETADRTNGSTGSDPNEGQDEDPDGGLGQTGSGPNGPTDLPRPTGDAAQPEIDPDVAEPQTVNDGTGPAPDPDPDPKHGAETSFTRSRTDGSGRSLRHPTHAGNYPGQVSRADGTMSARRSGPGPRYTARCLIGGRTTSRVPALVAPNPASVGSGTMPADRSAEPGLATPAARMPVMDRSDGTGGTGAPESSSFDPIVRQSVQQEAEPPAAEVGSSGPPGPPIDRDPPPPENGSPDPAPDPEDEGNDSASDQASDQGPDDQNAPEPAAQREVTLATWTGDDLSEQGDLAGMAQGDLGQRPAEHAEQLGVLESFLRSRRDQGFVVHGSWSQQGGARVLRFVVQERGADSSSGRCGPREYGTVWVDADGRLERVDLTLRGEPSQDSAALVADLVFTDISVDRDAYQAYRTRVQDTLAIAKLRHRQVRFVQERVPRWGRGDLLRVRYESFDPGNPNADIGPEGMADVTAVARSAQPDRVRALIEATIESNPRSRVEFGGEVLAPATDQSAEPDAVADVADKTAAEDAGVADEWSSSTAEADRSSDDSSREPSISETLTYGPNEVFRHDGPNGVDRVDTVVREKLTETSFTPDLATMLPSDIDLESLPSFAEAFEQLIGSINGWIEQGYSVTLVTRREDHGLSVELVVLDPDSALDSSPDGVPDEATRNTGGPDANRRLSFGSFGHVEYVGGSARRGPHTTYEFDAENNLVHSEARAEAGLPDDTTSPWRDREPDESVEEHRARLNDRYGRQHLRSSGHNHARRRRTDPGAQVYEVDAVLEQVHGELGGTDLTAASELPGLYGENRLPTNPDGTVLGWELFTDGGVIRMLPRGPNDTDWSSHPGFASALGALVPHWITMIEGGSQVRVRTRSDPDGMSATFQVTDPAKPEVDPVIAGELWAATGSTAHQATVRLQGPPEQLAGLRNRLTVAGLTIQPGAEPAPGRDAGSDADAGVGAEPAPEAEAQGTDSAHEQQNFWFDTDRTQPETERQLADLRRRFDAPGERRWHENTFHREAGPDGRVDKVTSVIHQPYPELNGDVRERARGLRHALGMLSGPGGPFFGWQLHPLGGIHNLLPSGFAFDQRQLRSLAWSLEGLAKERPLAVEAIRVSTPDGDEVRVTVREAGSQDQTVVLETSLRGRVTPGPTDTTEIYLVAHEFSSGPDNQVREQRTPAGRLNRLSMTLRDVFGETPGEARMRARGEEPDGGWPRGWPGGMKLFPDSLDRLVASRFGLVVTDWSTYHGIVEPEMLEALEQGHELRLEWRRVRDGLRLSYQVRNRSTGRTEHSRQVTFPATALAVDPAISSSTADRSAPQDSERDGTGLFEPPPGRFGVDFDAFSSPPGDVVPPIGPTRGDRRPSAANSRNLRRALTDALRDVGVRFAAQVGRVEVVASRHGVVEAVVHSDDGAAPFRVLATVGKVAGDAPAYVAMDRDRRTVQLTISDRMSDANGGVRVQATVAFALGMAEHFDWTGPPREDSLGVSRDPYDVLRLSSRDHGYLAAMRFAAMLLESGVVSGRSRAVTDELLMSVWRDLGVLADQPMAERIVDQLPSEDRSIVHRLAEGRLAGTLGRRTGTYLATRFAPGAMMLPPAVLAGVVVGELLAAVVGMIPLLAHSGAMAYSDKQFEGSQAEPGRPRDEVRTPPLGRLAQALPGMPAPEDPDGSFTPAPLREYYKKWRAPGTVGLVATTLLVAGTPFGAPVLFVLYGGMILVYPVVDRWVAGRVGREEVRRETALRARERDRLDRFENALAVHLLRLLQRFRTAAGRLSQFGPASTGGTHHDGPGRPHRGPTAPFEWGPLIRGLGTGWEQTFVNLTTQLGVFVGEMAIQGELQKLADALTEFDIREAFRQSDSALAREVSEVLDELNTLVSDAERLAGIVSAANPETTAADGQQDWRLPTVPPPPARGSRPTPVPPKRRFAVYGVSPLIITGVGVGLLASGVIGGAVAVSLVSIASTQVLTLPVVKWIDKQTELRKRDEARVAVGVQVLDRARLTENVAVFGHLAGLLTHVWTQHQRETDAVEQSETGQPVQTGRAPGNRLEPRQLLTGGVSTSQVRAAVREAQVANATGAIGQTPEQQAEHDRRHRMLREVEDLTDELDRLAAAFDPGDPNDVRALQHAKRALADAYNRYAGLDDLGGRQANFPHLAAVDPASGRAISDPLQRLRLEVEQARSRLVRTQLAHSSELGSRVLLDQLVLLQKLERAIDVERRARDVALETGDRTLLRRVSGELDTLVAAFDAKLAELGVPGRLGEHAPVRDVAEDTAGADTGKPADRDGSAPASSEPDGPASDGPESDDPDDSDGTPSGPQHPDPDDRPVDGGPSGGAAPEPESESTESSKGTASEETTAAEPRSAETGAPALPDQGQTRTGIAIIDVINPEPRPVTSPDRGRPIRQPALVGASGNAESADASDRGTGPVPKASATAVDEAPSSSRYDESGDAEPAEPEPEGSSRARPARDHERPRNDNDADANRTGGSDPPWDGGQPYDGKSGPEPIVRTDVVHIPELRGSSERAQELPSGIRLAPAPTSQDGTPVQVYPDRQPRRGDVRVGQHSDPIELVAMAGAAANFDYEFGEVLLVDEHEIAVTRHQVRVEQTPDGPVVRPTGVRITDPISDQLLYDETGSQLGVPAHECSWATLVEKPGLLRRLGKPAPEDSAAEPVDEAVRLAESLTALTGRPTTVRRLPGHPSEQGEVLDGPRLLEQLHRLRKAEQPAFVRLTPPSPLAGGQRAPGVWAEVAGVIDRWVVLHDPVHGARLLSAREFLRHVADPSDGTSDSWMVTTEAAVPIADADGPDRVAATAELPGTELWLPREPAAPGGYIMGGEWRQLFLSEQAVDSNGRIVPFGEGNPIRPAVDSATHLDVVVRHGQRLYDAITVWAAAASELDLELIQQLGEHEYVIATPDVELMMASDGTPVAYPTGTTHRMLVSDQVPVDQNGRLPDVQITSRGAAWPVLLSKSLAVADQQEGPDERRERNQDWRNLKPYLDEERAEAGIPPTPEEPPAGWERAELDRTLWQQAWDKAVQLSRVTGKPSGVRKLPGLDAGRGARAALVLDLFGDLLASRKPVVVRARPRDLVAGESGFSDAVAPGRDYAVVGVTEDAVVLYSPLRGESETIPIESFVEYFYDSDDQPGMNSYVTTMSDADLGAPPAVPATPDPDPNTAPDFEPGPDPDGAARPAEDEENAAGTEHDEAPDDFGSPDGNQWWIAYHGETSSELTTGGRTTRAQRIEWNPDGTPNLGKPLPLDGRVPFPSGDPGVGQPANTYRSAEGPEDEGTGAAPVPEPGPVPEQSGTGQGHGSKEDQDAGPEPAGDVPESSTGDSADSAADAVGNVVSDIVGILVPTRAEHTPASESVNQDGGNVEPTVPMPETPAPQRALPETSAHAENAPTAPGSSVAANPRETGLDRPSTGRFRVILRRSSAAMLTLGGVLAAIVTGGADAPGSSNSHPVDGTRPDTELASDQDGLPAGPDLVALPAVADQRLAADTAAATGTSDESERPGQPDGDPDGRPVGEPGRAGHGRRGGNRRRRRWPFTGRHRNNADTSRGSSSDPDAISGQAAPPPALPGPTALPTLVSLLPTSPPLDAFAAVRAEAARRATELAEAAADLAQRARIKQDSSQAAAADVVRQEEESSTESRLADSVAQVRAHRAKVKMQSAAAKQRRHQQIANGYEQAANHAATAGDACRALADAIGAGREQADIAALARDADARIEQLLDSLGRTRAAAELVPGTVLQGPPPHLGQLTDRINRMLAENGIRHHFTAQRLRWILSAEFRQVTSEDGLVLPIDGHPRDDATDLAQIWIRLRSSELTEVLADRYAPAASEVIDGKIDHGGHGASMLAAQNLARDYGFGTGLVAAMLPDVHPLRAVLEALDVGLDRPRSERREEESGRYRDARDSTVLDNRAESIQYEAAAAWELRVRTSALDPWSRPEIVRNDSSGDAESLRVWLSHADTVSPPSPDRTTDIERAGLGDKRADKLPAHKTVYVNGLETLTEKVVGDALELLGSLDRVGYNHIRSLLTRRLPSRLGEASRPGGIGQLIFVAGEPVAYVQVRATVQRDSARLIARSSFEHWMERLRVGFAAASGRQSFNTSGSWSLRAGVKGTDLGSSPVDATAQVSGGLSNGRSDGTSVGRTGIDVGLRRRPTAAFEVRVEYEVTVHQLGRGNERSSSGAGSAMLRMPENDAFWYGFPVEAEAVTRTDDGWPVLRGDPRNDGRWLALPSWFGNGPGQLSSPAQVQLIGADPALHQVLEQLSREGLVPQLDQDLRPILSELPLDPLLAASQLKNLERVRQLLPAVAAETWYPEAISNGIPFELTVHEGGKPSVTRTFRLRLRQDFDTARFLGRGPHATVRLPIGSDNAVRSRGESRQWPVAASLRAGDEPSVGQQSSAEVRYGRSLRGRSYGRAAGSMVNRVSLIEPAGEVAEFVVDGTLQIDEWTPSRESEGVVVEIACSARLEIDGALCRRVSAPEALPTPDPAATGPDPLGLDVPGVARTGETDPALLDAARIMTVDIGDPASRVGPKLPASMDADPSAVRKLVDFLHPTQLSTHGGEWRNTGYRTRLTTRPSAPSPTNPLANPRSVSASFTGQVRNEVLVAVTAQITGDIGLMFQQTSVTDGGFVEHTVEGTGRAAEAGQVSTQDTPDSLGRTGNQSWNRTITANGGSESLVVRGVEGLHYVFLGDLESAVKLREGSSNRPVSVPLDSGKVLFAVSEQDMLRLYGKGRRELPLSLVADAVERLRTGRLSLDQQSAAAVLYRYRADRAETTRTGTSLPDTLERLLATHTDEALLKLLGAIVGSNPPDTQDPAQVLEAALEPLARGLGERTELNLPEHYRWMVAAGPIDRITDVRGRTVDMLAQVYGGIDEVMPNALLDDPELAEELAIDLGGEAWREHLENILDPNGFERSYPVKSSGTRTHAELTVRIRGSFDGTVTTDSAPHSLAKEDAIEIRQRYLLSTQGATRAYGTSWAANTGGSSTSGTESSIGVGTDRSRDRSATSSEQLTRLQRLMHADVTRVERGLQLVVEVEHRSVPGAVPEPGTPIEIVARGTQLVPRALVSLAPPPQNQPVEADASPSTAIVRPSQSEPAPQLEKPALWRPGRRIELPDDFYVEGTLPYVPGAPRTDALFDRVYAELARSDLLTRTGARIQRTELVNQLSAAHRNAVFPMLLGPGSYPIARLRAARYGQWVYVMARASVSDLEFLTTPVESAEIGNVNRRQEETLAGMSGNRLYPLSGSVGGADPEATGLSVKATVGEQTWSHDYVNVKTRKETSEFEKGAVVTVGGRVHYDLWFARGNLADLEAGTVRPSAFAPDAATGFVALTMFYHDLAPDRPGQP